MKRIVWMLAAAACVAMASLQLSLAANDDEPVQLTATNVRATAFESVTVQAKDNSKVGVVETLRKDGHVILLLEMDVGAPWTEDLRWVSISGSKIALIGKDGQELPPIGHFRTGVFFEGHPGLYVKRSSKWPEENPPSAFNVAFLVPTGSAPFTLKADQSLSAPITAPAKTSPEPHITDKMSVKVISAKLVDELHATFRVGKERAPTDVVNPDGPFLAVTFELTPNDFNGSSTDKFFWTTDWFGVRYDGKFHSHTVGEAFMKSISRNVSHNTGFSNGQWGTATATFYFPVTPGAKTFKLLCLMREVAEGAVGR